MQVFRVKEELSQHLDRLRQQDKSIGLVPTMGALHQGHLSLVGQALSENDRVVVSIFVNPTQFDKAEDLEKYPRSVDSDVELLQSLNDELLVFVPDASDLYNGQVKAKSYDFGHLETVMEGRYRNGHFDGVGTVLNLLFRSVQPDKAYFGEKDYQQLLVVKELVRKEALEVDIIGCEIYREPNGLAMSSRNERLTELQRQEAGSICHILERTAADFNHKNISQLIAQAQSAFKEVPSLELEYFEIARADNLRTDAKKVPNTRYRAFVAAYSGKVRLIDNMALN
jgi:pantoate--beta-alanine ligase